MKKIKLLIIFLISIFVFNINVKAASANLTVSSRSIYVGDTFTVNVNMKSAAAWNIHVISNGPVNDECEIHEVNVTDKGDDTSKTFTATCSATAEGTINIMFIKSDVTSASDGNAVNISGSTSVNVSKKTTTTTTRTTTTTKATTTKTTTTTKSVTNNSQTTINKTTTTNPKTSDEKIKLVILGIIISVAFIIIGFWKIKKKGK